MSAFRFTYPIQVRYGDLDPQWHVNNANFLTFIEQARFAYLVHLGLFDGESFLDLGLIVADVHIAYRAPISVGTDVRVALRVSRIGNKSLTFEYQVEDATGGTLFARAENVMVAYDYRSQTSQPVPDEWRRVISEFEALEG